jgi:hypothetical protein
MRDLLIGLVVLASSATASAKDRVYEGTWVTTNRPLDGTLTCVVTDLGDNKWRGQFHGFWFTRSLRLSGSPSASACSGAWF